MTGFLAAGVSLLGPYRDHHIAGRRFPPHPNDARLRLRQI